MSSTVRWRAPDFAVARGDGLGEGGRPCAQAADPQVSPDGRQLALTLFASDSADESDIWIRDLVRGTVSRVTTDESSQSPVWAPTQDRIAHCQWSPDGREIYYHHGDPSSFGAVHVEWTADGPVLGAPRTIFRVPLRVGLDARHKFVVTPEGDRSLVLLGANSVLGPLSPMHIVSDRKRAVETR